MSKQQYESEGHSFLSMGKKTKVPYVYCVKCGLIYLKNPLTEWAAQKGCNYKEHPSYRNKLGVTNPFRD